MVLVPPSVNFDSPLVVLVAELPVDESTNVAWEDAVPTIVPVEDDAVFPVELTDDPLEAPDGCTVAESVFVAVSDEKTAA